MQLLAIGKYCKNQAAKVRENTYGIQCHLELTLAMLEVWVSEDGDLQTLNTDKLIAHFGFIQRKYCHNGIRLLENFLNVVASLI